MKVLVDTPIWSYALRSQRTGFELHVDTLKMLIANQRVLIIGAIRQEILSGYSDLGKFNILKHTLSAFHNTLIIDDDYVQAAMFYNRCRQQGIQDSHTDFLKFVLLLSVWMLKYLLLIKILSFTKNMFLYSFISCE